MPPTGETDNLQGPICSQNRYLCRNNLETWKSGCKRTIKGGKGQLKQTESKTHLVQSKRTATRAAALTIAMQRPQWSHVTRLSRPVHNAAQRDSPRTVTHSIIAPSGPRSHLIYYVFNPLLIHWKKSKICPTTMQSRRTTRQAPPSAISPLPKQTLCYQSGHCNQHAHHHLLKHGWHCHMREFCNGLKHHTLSRCNIPFIFSVIGMQTYYYTILLRITRRVGVLKFLLDHYHSFGTYS